MHIVGLAAALSALVDGALIAVEAIVRRRAQDSSRSLAAAVFDAMGEIRHPVIYATLIGALVIAPVFWLEGPPGAFFGPLAQSYLLAVVASMVVLFAVVPGLALILLRGNIKIAAGRAAGVVSLAGSYQRLLSRFSARPAPAYVIAAAGAWALVACLAVLDWSPVPTFKERDAVISWEARPELRIPA